MFDVAYLFTIDERVYELLCYQLSLANEGKKASRMGKRIDEKDRKLYDKAIEIPEKYLQGQSCGNIEPSL